jgi:serine/threonine protein kinase
MVRPTDNRVRATDGDAEERYRLLRELGRGSTATVWLAYDRARARRVALKRVLTPSSSSLLGIKREFRTIAPLRHRNLVRLHDLYTDDLGAFFTMEFVEGRDLRRVVQGGRPPSWAIDGAAAFVVDVARQILSALCFLHGHGVVHRDLKPSNVMLGETGTLKLLDFGVLAMVGGDDTADVHRLGGGTPGYAAPEQMRGEPPTFASDMYSLGVLLVEVARALLPGQGWRRSFGTARASVPANLARLCDHLVREDQRARPNARAALTALGARAERSRRHGSRDPVAIGVEDPERPGAWLRARLESVTDGEFDLVIVEAPNRGETALLRFADGFARLGGGVVLAGRARRGEHVAYNVLDAAVDALAALLAGTVPDAELGRDLALASTEFPVLAGKRPAGPAVSRSRAFDALIRILASLAGAGGVFLIVDGLHAADPGSLAFVDRLLERRPPGVALVASFSRSDAKPGALAWLHGQRHLGLEAPAQSARVWTVNAAASSRVCEGGLAEAARFGSLATAPGREFPEPEDARELGQRRRDVTAIGAKGHREALRGLLLGGGGLDEGEAEDLRLLSAARR